MDNQPASIPTPATNRVLPGVADLIRQSWPLYRDRFKTLIAINLLPVVLTAILSYVLYIPVISAPPPPFGAEPVGPSIGRLLMLFGLGVIVLIAALWAMIAQVLVLRDTPGALSASSALAMARKILLPYLWISVLSSMLIIAGIMFLIIPGVVFMIWFAFAGYVLIEENLTGWQAMKRSRAYVKGRFGSVLWRVGAIIFLLILASWFAVPFSQPIEDLVSAVISWFAVPFLTVYMLLLYRSLRGSSPAAAVGNP